MSKIALILGANGKFGRAAHNAFVGAGWHVRKFDRANDALKTAISGVDVVVNAWNPPSYGLWHKQLLSMHRQVMDAMQDSDATVIVPGNVYVFGQATPAPWGKDTAHKARNPLGKLRIDMEAAYKTSGIRTIILRGGDFLDTRASGNWFDMVMIKGLGKGKFTYPGDLDTVHSWAFLPDMARAAVMLAEQRDRLPRFADIPFPGYTLSGLEIAQTLSEILERPVRAKTMSWLPIQVLTPFVPMFRGLPEMRYLWNTSHRLDTSEFGHWLPGFEPTPVAAALSQSIAHLGLDADFQQSGSLAVTQSSPAL